jgi:tetratricopeptide (TPR) repeat protein
MNDEKLLFLLVVTVLFLTVGCGEEKKDAKSFEPTGNAMIIAEGPLILPEDSNTEANGHNNEGISHYNQGHYDLALKHFKIASSIASGVGEAHYNEALCLDKLGRHGDATNQFYAARKKAHANEAILKSGILNAHAPMKREGS